MIAIGNSGSAYVNASATENGGRLIEAATASASAAVDGTSTAMAQAAIGVISAGYATGFQALALEAGSPSAASTSSPSTPV